MTVLIKLALFPGLHYFQLPSIKKLGRGLGTRLVSDRHCSERLVVFLPTH